MGHRREARILALQALYMVDAAHFRPGQAFAACKYRMEPPMDEATLAFAKTLFEGAHKTAATLDRKIQKCAKNWALERMTSVDLNILRMAAYEMSSDLNTPVRVIIDESIEIAKKYSSEHSGRFINGLLDALKDMVAKKNVRPPTKTQKSTAGD